MSGELELSKVQESGELVNRRETQEDDGIPPFIMMAAGFAASTSATFVTLEGMVFVVGMMGSMVLTLGYTTWKNAMRTANKISDIDYYNMLQLEALTKVKAPVSVYKELVIMRANLNDGEQLVFDPFVMMAVTRPEGHKTWASLSPTGMNFIVREPQITAEKWDEEFASDEKEAETK